MSLNSDQNLRLSATMDTELLFAVFGAVFLLLWTTKNTRNLQTSAKCLVEQHAGLEFRHKWEPSEECDWSEQKQPHH